ncbi:MAG: CaiB/BaiF CoA-transferase family protein [Gammaproteobacteria bacterium]
MSGPLTGIKVLEFSGIGPGPFCGMMLADLGAEVIRLDRPQAHGKGNPMDFQNRSKKSITANLKNPDTVSEIMKIIKNVDAIIEGFRPGVMEKLGLGPEECLLANPRLVYGRMTGWGQEGPLAHAAGHDINYIALTGALDSIGRKNETPPPPLNLIGDYGGGGMMLAYGILAGIINVRNGGSGQVVDAAMVDGASALMAMFYSFKASGFWREERGSNLLDGGAHFYDTFKCKDNKYLSVGSIEPQFYAILLEKLELTDERFKQQMNSALWPELKESIANRILTKTRDEWSAIFDGTDACVAPVLSLSEAPENEHLKARKTFIEVEGYIQPAPAPRFSKTANQVKHAASKAGQHNLEISELYGLDISRLG